MLTRADYESYLKEISDIETRMIIMYAKCVDVYSDEKANQIFIHLSDQERRHAALVKRLSSLIIGYDVTSV